MGVDLAVAVERRLACRIRRDLEGKEWRRELEAEAPAECLGWCVDDYGRRHTPAPQGLDTEDACELHEADADDATDRRPVMHNEQDQASEYKQGQEHEHIVCDQAGNLMCCPSDE
jgi:hypothetical protein